MPDARLHPGSIFTDKGGQLRDDAGSSPQTTRISNAPFVTTAHSD
jgi:hypothetical protein